MGQVDGPSTWPLGALLLHIMCPYINYPASAHLMPIKCLLEGSEYY